jgi:hypothetical protein
MCPNAEQMKTNFMARKTTFSQATAGTPQPHLRNYVKPDNSLALTFVPETEALTQINVNTYMKDQKGCSNPPS